MRSQPNQVRIIAGKWRGRKLNFPSEKGLRPTSDRIRETLFNWLAPVLPGASCLDLFAGSGALGFEAASRGASHVVLVEPQPAVVQALRENLQRLDAECIEIVQSDAEAFLSGVTGKFDVVFVDPPFDDTRLLATAVRLLGTCDCLKPDALIYLEMPKKAPPPVVPEHWSPARRKSAGQVTYQLYCSGA